MAARRPKAGRRREIEERKRRSAAARKGAATKKRKAREELRRRKAGRRREIEERKRRSAAARKGAATKKRKAREELRRRSIAARKGWRTRRRKAPAGAGLATRAEAIVQALLERVGLEHWTIESDRPNLKEGRSARATAVGDPVEPADYPVEELTRWDAIRDALEVAPDERGRIEMYEANVRVAHIDPDHPGDPHHWVWETLVALERRADYFVAKFDDEWSDLPERPVRRKSESDEPITAIQVFMVFHFVR